MKETEKLHKLAQELEATQKMSVVRVTIEPTTVNLIMKKFERAVPEDKKEQWESLDKQEAIQTFITELFEDILDSDFFSMAKLKNFFEKALGE